MASKRAKKSGAAKRTRRRPTARRPARKTTVRKKATTKSASHPNAHLFPAGLAGPALRALKNAGIHSMDLLRRWTEKELEALHGLGPKAMDLLRKARRGRRTS